MRKIESDRFLRSRRIFKQARWIDQIYLLHAFDRRERQRVASDRPSKAYPPLDVRTASD